MSIVWIGLWRVRHIAVFVALCIVLLSCRGGGKEGGGISGGAGLTFLGANAQGYERYRNEKDGTVLVKLPGGIFTMGSAPGVGDSSEHPAHTVTLSAFYMAEAELTWRQWKAYVAANPGAYMPPNHSVGPGGIVVGDDFPTNYVSWFDVQSYLDWAELRFPTEAEWEYAARAGRTGDVYATQDGTISHDLANYDGLGGRDTFDYTSPVRSFPANAFGLYDMSGNLREWCADWFDDAYYTMSAATDPAGPASPASGLSRAIRGGDWISKADFTRAATRGSTNDPGLRYHGLGVRPARSAP